MRSLRRLAVPVAAALLAVLPAAAEQRKVEDWFGGTQGEAYREVAPAIVQAAQAAREARVPDELIVERLTEGAAKSVAPDVLQRAMEQDVDNLAAFASVLDRRLPRLDPADRTEALRLGASAARGGIEPQTLDAAVAWTLEDGHELGRALSALVAVASLRRSLALDQSAALALAKAFVRSKEKTSRFAAFVSLLSGARARGLSAQTVTDTALAALAEGRTFLALERELNRRSAR